MHTEIRVRHFERRRSADLGSSDQVLRSRDHRGRWRTESFQAANQGNVFDKVIIVPVCVFYVHWLLVVGLTCDNNF